MIVVYRNSMKMVSFEAGTMLSSLYSKQTFLVTDQPSFEEGIRSGSPFIDNDADENHRIDDFRPLYPIYKQTIV